MARFLSLLFRVAVGLLGLVAILFATRAYWLPDRFAVNVPMRSLVGGAPEAGNDAVVDRLKAPPGFVLSRFATGLANARFMRVTEAGDLLLSQPREGKVTLLFKDRDGDGAADGWQALLTGLDRPHGLALHDGFLYVAEMTAVGRIRFEATSRRTTGRFERVITGLPSGGNHWTRTIGFGPDGFLYVAIGSSCNVCLEKDPRRAAISRYDPATWQGEIFATGLRNSVGFAWRTAGGEGGGGPELIATDNGRDLLGNDFPPCELNRVVKGGFYGWPFANGDRVKDPDLGAGHEAEIAASLVPIHNFAAHNAPLGITFLDAAATPPPYRGAALVALHGSWNRTSKDGYKVVSLHWGEDGTITQRDFLTGFLEDENVIGRPVDAAQDQEGAIYISDDYGGSIFKIVAGERRPQPARPATAAAASPTASGRPGPEGASPERGARVWEANRCEQCHDPKATGTAPEKTVKVLAHLGGKYDVEKMVTYLKAPQPPMPLFEMTDAERLDLAAYLLDRFR